jgi:hypothetical protein
MAIPQSQPMIGHRPFLLFSIETMRIYRRCPSISSNVTKSPDLPSDSEIRRVLSRNDLDLELRRLSELSWESSVISLFPVTALTIKRKHARMPGMQAQRMPRSISRMDQMQTGMKSPISLLG